MLKEKKKRRSRSEEFRRSRPAPLRGARSTRFLRSPARLPFSRSVRGRACLEFFFPPFFLFVQEEVEGERERTGEFERAFDQCLSFSVFALYACGSRDTRDRMRGNGPSLSHTHTHTSVPAMNPPERAEELQPRHRKFHSFLFFLSFFWRLRGLFSKFRLTVLASTTALLHPLQPRPRHPR